MEVWSWTDCEMGYGVGAYWYGFADTTSNRKPEPVEVLNVPPLPDASAAAEDAQTASTLRTLSKLGKTTSFPNRERSCLCPRI